MSEAEAVPSWNEVASLWSSLCVAYGQYAPAALTLMHEHGSTADVINHGIPMYELVDLMSRADAIERGEYPDPFSE